MSSIQYSLCLERVLAFAFVSYLSFHVVQPCRHETEITWQQVGHKAVTLQIPHCHPQRGGIVDTQFELAFDVGDLLINLTPTSAETVANVASMPRVHGETNDQSAQKNREECAENHDSKGNAQILSGDEWLVPLVVSSYDFKSCTGNRSVIHSALLPLKPVVFDVHVQSFDLRNTEIVQTNEICKMFGISENEHREVGALAICFPW